MWLLHQNFGVAAFLVQKSDAKLLICVDKNHRETYTRHIH